MLVLAVVLIQGLCSMGFLDGLLGGLGGGQRAQQAYGFRTNLTPTDGLPVGIYGTAALAGALCALAGAGYVKVWQTVVPAQQRMHWGFGSPATPENQGYMWVSILDVAAGEGLGKLRLVQANARETKKLIVGEYDLSRLSLRQAAVWTVAGARPTDRNVHMVALPEKVEFPLVGEDSLLILEYWHSAGVAVAGLDSMEFVIPCTVYQ